jgi:polypeptide N-acetylgalactosaminyltransferase
LYLEKLPKLSVIIPFHDEHLSVLLRSVHSIVRRTPEILLEEIILVDDYSNKDFLKDQLEKHIESNFKKDLVKIIRLPKREGLIRTRIAGAKQAKAEVLVFFDSHIECGVNWATPLLEPIAKDYKTSVCPFIDVINEDTFAYSAQDEGARGAFDWDLYYKRLPLLERDLKNPSEPFESPVMAGGLFAISAKWFWELGGYDPGLDIWGGEQYELSFKIWQCGGKLVDAPCSHVAHIYRKFNPFGAAGSGDFLTRNHKRVAEVWMDDYKKYFYKSSSYIINLEFGDVSKQKEIREKLQCKSFKWFMDNVAFDLVNYYPPVPPQPYASGEIRSVAAALCIDSKFKREESTFGLDTCLRDNRDHSGEQRFELTWRHDLRPISSDRCFDVSSSTPGAPVILFKCHGYRGNQEFLYNPQTQQIYHPITNSCLEASVERKEILMNPCDKIKKSQQWMFSNVNVTQIAVDFKFPV